MKKVLFISSKGGHFSELMRLSPLFDEYQTTIVTEEVPFASELRERFGEHIYFLREGTRVKPLSYAFKLLANTLSSFRLFLRLKPEVIVSTGAHTAGPLCLIGHLLGARIVFIETAANVHTPSATGKAVYRFADVFIVQHEEMLEVFPRALYRGALIP